MLPSLHDTFLKRYRVAAGSAQPIRDYLRPPRLPSLPRFFHPSRLFSIARSLLHPRFRYGNRYRNRTRRPLTRPTQINAPAAPNSTHRHSSTTHVFCCFRRCCGCASTSKSRSQTVDNFACVFESQPPSFRFSSGSSGMNRQASLESQRQLSSRFETNRDAPRDRAIAGMRLVAAPPVVPRQPADRLIWDPKVRA